MSSATESVIHFLNSIKNKSFSAFKKCFHPDPNSHFVGVFPGGKKVFSSAELINLHPPFFNSPLTKFTPINSSDSFSEDHFSYSFQSDLIFQVGVDVKVTKPVILSAEGAHQELETINNHICLTLAFDAGPQKWFPQTITNTVIDR